MPCRLAVLLVLVVWALGGVAGRAQESLDHEDGAVAPPNRWYIRGGSAARSGASAGDPATGDIETAWEWRGKGEIEGEPVVWDDRIVLSVKTGDQARSLVVLRLADGKPAATERVFKTSVPLEPAVWGQTIIVRASPTRIESYPLRLTQTPQWSYDAKTAVSAPLVFGPEIYTGTDSALLSLRAGRKDPVWRRPGSFRGRPSLRGPHVYALEYGSDGMCRLGLFTRGSGEAVAREEAGTHKDAAVPPFTAEPSVIVLGGDVLVHHALPILASEDGDIAAGIWFRRRVEPDGKVFLYKPSVFDPLASPAGGDGRWLGVVRDLDGGNVLMLCKGHTQDGPQNYALADRVVHPEFVQEAAALSIAGGVAYAGGRAFALETLNILWEAPVKPLIRAVPARETVLVVEKGGRLVALRPRRTETPDASVIVLDPGSDAPAGRQKILGGTCVLGDGTIVSGAFVLDRGAAKISRDDAADGKPVSWPLKEVLVATDREKRLVHAVSAASAVHGLGVWARSEAAGRYAALAEEACASGDPALVDRFLTEARALGAADLAVAKVEKRLSGLSARPKTADRTVAEAFAGKARRVAALDAELPWSAASSLPASAPAGLRADLLRAVLAADPKHAGALGAIRALLPGDLAIPEPFDAPDWLDFAEATQQTSIALVPSPPEPGTGDITWQQRELGRTRFTWRKDIAGIDSQSLLILTPLSSPGRIARCLSMGELVCETLDRLLAAGKEHRETRFKMILHLFESQEEYKVQASKPMIGFEPIDPDALEWTSGHFDPHTNLSRIFLPRREDAFADVMDTYAHELTHHWLQVRCPLFTTTQAYASVAARGYWIVEGFAKLVEEFRFDLRNRRCEPFNPRCWSLDVLANAKESDLLKWKDFYAAHRGWFHGLKKSPRLVVPMRWSLGTMNLLSDVHLFYAQGAATCHYLFHAEEGKYRPALIAYLTRHYQAQTGADDVEKIIGLPPEELGRRVANWAREVLASGTRR